MNESTAAASGLAIYGKTRATKDGGGKATAGCVMELTIDQVQYLLGRNLSWNPQNEL